MITHGTTPGNAKRLVQLQAMMAELLTESLRQGFFGKAMVEVSVQDGTIQCIRRVVERIEK